MKSTSEILASMGIEVQPPVDAAPMVQALGLDLDDAETVAYSSDVRLMAEEADACRTCKGLETCQLTPAGFQHVYRRTPAGHPSFSVRACEKRVQYEELVRNERLLASCRIPESLRLKSFKGFDSTENGEAVRAAAQVLRDPRHKGIVFYGPTGVGKTHLAAAILNNRIINGGTGIYATLPELMDDLRSAMRNNRIEEARAAIIDTDILFLDDMGAENPSEFVVEELFKIINGRMLRERQIVATSNLSPDSFRERYAGVGGSRIVSRLYESCDWIEMTGRDRRM